MRKLVFMACFSYLLPGFGHIIIGTVMEPMIAHYNLTYSDGGQLIMNQFLGFLAGVLLAPFILKIIGRRATMLISLLLFALVQIGLFAMLPWPVLLAIVPFGGAGFGMIETVLAGLIIAELKEKKASVMALTELFFGIGAMVVPIIAAGFIFAGQWNGVFAAISGLVMVCFAFWLLLRFDEFENSLRRPKQVSKVETKTKAPQIGYSKSARALVAVGCFFFFLYVGVEMTFPNYLPSILAMTSDFSESMLALSITVFWGAMTAGRLVMVFIVNRVGIGKLFVGTVIGQMITLGLFAASPSPAFSLASIFAAGLMMGGIFSLALLVINQGIPGLEDRTTSLLIAVGGLGGAFVPKLAGSLLDHYPVGTTLWTVFAFAVLMCVIMVVIFRVSKRMIERTIVHES